MVFSRFLDVDIEGRSGVLFPGTPNFSQLFTGTPLFYHGSTIQVQEILTISSEIIDEKLVDVNYEYYTPKYFLGNWQSNGLATQAFNHEDSGLLWELEQEIKRYSTYTITANPNAPQTFADGGSINQCNLQLVGAEVGTPLGSVSAFEPYKKNNILLYEGYRKPAALADTPYNQKLNSPGFYVVPGARINRVRLDITIINDIYTADTPWITQLCELGEKSCQQLFDESLIADFNSATPRVCPEGSTAGSGSWICPTDPTFIRDIYYCYDNVTGLPT
jgi:hypothetical protein